MKHYKNIAKNIKINRYTVKTRNAGVSFKSDCNTRE